MTAHVSETTDRLVAEFSSGNPFDAATDGAQVLDQAVIDLRDLREVIAALRAWEGVLTDFLADALGRNTIDVEDVGRVEIKRSANRKAWDHQALRARVLAAGRDERIIDPLTGEAEDLGSAVLRVLTDCAQIAYWRKEALAQRGIDVDEYCEQTPGGVRVVIT
jgi:hypothetical protein